MSIAIQMQSGEYVKLYEGAKISMHLKSALFNDKLEPASRSYQFKGPVKANTLIFGFANELKVRERVLVYDVKVYMLGSFWKHAKLEITDFDDVDFTFQIFIDRGFFTFDASRSLRSFKYENPYQFRGYLDQFPRSLFTFEDLGVVADVTITCNYQLPPSSTVHTKEFIFEFGVDTVADLVTRIIEWFNSNVYEYHYLANPSSLSTDEFFLYHLIGNTNPAFYVTWASSNVDFEVLPAGNLNNTALSAYRSLMINALADDDREFILVPVAAPDLYTTANGSYHGYINGYVPKNVSHAILIGQLATSEQPVMPFPVLKKMLYMILKETNTTVKEDTFFDDELANLILFNHEAINNFQRMIKNGWRYRQTGAFYYNDIVPDIPLNVFLNDLRLFFNLMLDFNTRDMSVRLLRVDHLLDEIPEDWTPYLVKKWQYRHEPVDCGLAYTWVEEPLSTELLPAIEDTQLAPPVNFKVDLPVTPVDGRVINQTLKENKFYFYNAGWSFYAEGLYGYKPLASTQLVTGCSPLFTIEVPFVKPSAAWPFHIKWLLPYTKQPGNMLPEDKVAAPHRYLIYRGMVGCEVKLVEGDETYVTAEYPFASSHNYDYNGNKVGDYSLAWNAEDGVHHHFWKRWLNFRRNSSPVMMVFTLPVDKLLSLDITRKKLVDGIEYFIDEIDFDVDSNLNNIRCKMYPKFNVHE